MSTVFEMLIIVVATWFVLQLVSDLFQPRPPVEPVDDPDAPVLAPRKDPPNRMSGSVALEEPDDDDSVEGYPPRTL